MSASQREPLSPSQVYPHLAVQAMEEDGDSDAISAPPRQPSPAVVAQEASQRGYWIQGFPRQPTLLHISVLVFTDALSLTLASALVQDSGQLGQSQANAFAGSARRAEKRHGQAILQ